MKVFTKHVKIILKASFQFFEVSIVNRLKVNERKTDMNTDDTITIYDVAREAGVSMATGRRVVNGNKNVKDNTRQKVLEVIERLDYRPNAVARGLASKKTTTVGVVIPNIANAYFSNLARGIDDIAAMYKYNIVLASSDEDDEKEINVVNSLFAKQVDGIIFMGYHLTEKLRVEFCSTTTTPRDSRALSEDETLPYSAVSSLTRSAPICRAAKMASCLTAPLRGLKPCALGPSLTQRSSTWPVAGSHTTHCPFCLRTVGVPPGGVNRRTQLESGAI